MSTNIKKFSVIAEDIYLLLCKPFLHPGPGTFGLKLCPNNGKYYHKFMLSDNVKFIEKYKVLRRDVPSSALFVLYTPGERNEKS